MSALSHGVRVNPNVANHLRGKTRQSAPDVTVRSPPPAEYLTVRQIFSEASTVADGVLSRERSGLYRRGLQHYG
jgi:hypothetical protein